MAAPVVIRVKRKRQEPPVQQLVVASDVHGSRKAGEKLSRSDVLARQLDQLSTEEGSAQLRRVRFSRVATSELNDDKALIATATTAATATETTQPEETKQEAPTGKRSREEAQLEYIPSGRHRVVETENGSMVVFDLAPKSSRPRLEETKASPEKRKGVRVLTPLERLMDAAITTALDTGDFSEVLEALERGASASYQRTSSDGRTCLMAAALHNNSKMVGKLLSAGADPEARDQEGRNAMDYCQLVPETKEVRHQLYFAMMDKAKQAPRSRDGADGKDADEEEGEDDSDEYVYDILRMDPTMAAATADGSDDAAAAQQAGAADDSDAAPFVYIPGLSFHDDGRVELVFEHDDDWSDLADDEDPDSNDERYEGNDYPDEEDGDQDEDEEDADSDLEGHISRMNLPPSALRHLHLGGVMRPGVRAFGDQSDPVEGYDPDEPDDPTEQWQESQGFGTQFLKFPMDRELSDEEVDEDGYPLAGSSRALDHRPPRTAVAYDPEYDEDDYGDGYNTYENYCEEY